MDDLGCMATLNCVYHVFISIFIKINHLYILGILANLFCMISLSIKSSTNKKPWHKYNKMTEDERDNLSRYKRNNRIEKLILKELESVLLKELKDEELIIK